MASMTSADTQNTGATGVAPETTLLQVPRATLHAFAALLFRAPTRETCGASRAVARTRALSLNQQGSFHPFGVKTSFLQVKLDGAEEPVTRPHSGGGKDSRASSAR